MLQNAYFLAKIGADTAENEQHFAEILPKIGNYPTPRPPVPCQIEPDRARCVAHLMDEPLGKGANELEVAHLMGKSRLEYLVLPCPHLMSGVPTAQMQACYHAMNAPLSRTT